ncbi:TetR/AcrR family transcriptional regulator [Streptomyces sp. 8L]|uniref:TetR/AcrR family transcriptional regulator n=1 Tax=Streptomyces sp. 8L TaxID=2877242 RepID=UPI001CD57AEE|nr:TetR/AcrR family transcriptional regulator [Streptomyces sp. 8L]MCA1220072.1 TetR/AcrR family transcriptional regulator [Streptomyces sp. 8L]
MTPPVKRRSGQHHGDLRRALEEAALELVAERGPLGFTLAEASRRAGVSVAAPYKHFADREALLAALAERGYREQRERFVAAVARSEDPVERLAAFAATYVRFAAEERALFDVAFSAGLDKPEHPGLATAGEELLAALLPAAAGLVPDEEEAYDLLLRVASAAHGIALFLRQGLFGVSGQAVEATAARAARTARDIAAGAVGRSDPAG